MSKLLFDFSKACVAQAWTAIDDRVMGGASRSSLQHDLAGHAVFDGTVSLERNGGFASVRSGPADLGEAKATSCVIEVRGDPKPLSSACSTTTVSTASTTRPPSRQQATGGRH